MQNFEGFFKQFLSSWRQPLVKISARLNNIWGSKSPKHPKRGHFMDAQSIQKTLNIFNCTTTYAILMKVTTNMYLIKVFHFTKSWGVTHKVQRVKTLSKWAKKSIFGLISAVAYLMHHLACHHWWQFQRKLTIFWGVLAEKTLKSSLKWQFLLVRKYLKI